MSDHNLFKDSLLKDKGRENHGPNSLRESRRLLCSDLVNVRWDSGRGFTLEAVAILEDYSSTGASLVLGSKLDPGVSIHLRTPAESFGAYVRHCSWRENGYVIGVEFHKPRTDEVCFIPDHLLDPADL